MSASLAARAATLPLAALAGLATSAVLIDSRGPEAFGYITLVGTLFLLLPFADLGVGAAVVDSFGKSDPNGPIQTLGASIKLLVLVGSVLAGAALALAPFLDWAAVLSGGGADATAAVTACLLAFAVSLPFSLGQRVLLGIEKNHLHVALSVVAPVVTLGAAIVSAEFPSVLPGTMAALAFPLGLLVANIASFVVGLTLAKMTIRATLNAARRASFSEMRALFSIGGPMLIVTLALPLAFQSDRFILSHQSSAVELAVYSLAAQLYQPIWAVATTASLPLWPSFQRVYRTMPQGLSNQWRKAVVVFIALGSFLGVGYLLFAPVLGAIASRGELTISLGLAATFALFVLVQCGHLPSGMLLMDESGLRFQALCVSLMLALNLTLSWVLATRYGALGPVIASSVAVFTCQLAPGLIRANRVSAHRSASGAEQGRGSVG